MKNQNRFRFIASCALLAFSINAQAQVKHNEPINVVLAPHQPVEFRFPNEFDLTHTKLVEFHGSAFGLNGNLPQPTQLTIQFDWLDLSGNKQLSPATLLLVQPATRAPFPIDLAFTIPFCPQEVSIDFLLSDPVATWQLGVSGTFSHECVVPEAETVAPVCVALVGALGWAWRRHSKQSM